MKIIESSGQTREEAIQNGLTELGVAMDEVERIDIIDEGSKGFLGMGKRPVRVRLTVDMAAISSNKSQGRQERRHDSRRDRNTAEKASQGGARNEQERQAPRDGAQDRQSKRAKGQSQPQNQRDQQNRRNGQNRASGDQNRRNKQKRHASSEESRSKHRAEKDQEAAVSLSGERQGSFAEKKKAASLIQEGTEATRLAEMFANNDDLQAVLTVEPVPEGAREEEAIEPISDAQGNEMAAMLKEIVDRMGLTAEVRFIRDESDSPCLSMKSETDSAILIGKHGITLNALQYLVNRMLPSGDNENTERLMVDVGEYVSRRRAALVDMAKKMAKRAKETGRNVKLKPLSPQERRIVHLALEKDSDVRTYSQGDSLYRNIIINPVNIRRGGAPRPQRSHPHRKQQNAASPGER